MKRVISFFVSLVIVISVNSGFAKAGNDFFDASEDALTSDLKRAGASAADIAKEYKERLKWNSHYAVNYYNNDEDQRQDFIDFLAHKSSSSTTSREAQEIIEEFVYQCDLKTGEPVSVGTDLCLRRPWKVGSDGTRNVSPKKLNLTDMQEFDRLQYSYYCTNAPAARKAKPKFKKKCDDFNNDTISTADLLDAYPPDDINSAEFDVDLKANSQKYAADFDVAAKAKYLDPDLKSRGSRLARQGAALVEGCYVNTEVLNDNQKSAVVAAWNATDLLRNEGAEGFASRAGSYLLDSHKTLKALGVEAYPDVKGSSTDFVSGRHGLTKGHLTKTPLVPDDPTPGTLTPAPPPPDSISGGHGGHHSHGSGSIGGGSPFSDDDE